VLTLIAIFGCTPTPSGGTITAAYDVAWTTEPTPPAAGAPADMTLTVLGLDGDPVEDLQRNHDRMVHTVFISADLRTFMHLHQEDTRPIEVEDLRAATFSFPVTFPTSGEYLVAFDYAHRNLWLQTTDRLVVGGAPGQASAPDLAGGEAFNGPDVQATLSWTGAPVVGGQAAWEVTLLDEGGAEIVDLVPWLSADGHCVFVSEDLSWVSHSHAWVPGMEDMTPNMEMPHTYDGPTVRFRAYMPVSGGWRMWCQFVRASNPAVITVSFPFEVAP
jgi:hypothetical protein